MKKSELFDLYLQDKINEDQLAEFKARLKDDPSFNKEFQSHKEIRYAIRHNARIEIRNQLDRFESEVNSDSNKPSRAFWKKAIFTATFISAILIIIFFQNSVKILEDREAYQTYYNTPNLDEILIDPSINLNGLESNALLAYQSANYPMASENLLEVVDSLRKPELYLVSGISAMEVGNYELAVDQFNIVINNFEDYKHHALWFSAMSFLAIEKRTEALCSLYSLHLLAIETSRYKTEEALESLGVPSSLKSSVGLIENLYTETDSTSSSNFKPLSQKGTLSDLTTRNQFEFYFTTSRQDLSEGKIVEYSLLEAITDVNPIGVAFIKDK